MARSRRLFVPGLSHHVIKRGNNRQAVFRSDTDRKIFLELLRRATCRRPVSVHGYVLMTNHVHLIVTPESPVSLPGLMKELGERYGQYYNRKYQRIGTPWTGRYKGILIGSERYWLTCLRYIEQNPVRAGMTSDAGAYAWSSYAAHARGRWPDWLTPHPIYEALGRTPEDRQIAYRNLCHLPLPEDHLAFVR